jgi:hypothetical protein
MNLLTFLENKAVELRSDFNDVPNWVIEAANEFINKNKPEKEFPNGFTSWVETHVDVVSEITRINLLDEPFGLVEQRHSEQGLGGLYELAEELTDEFELKYKGVEWGLELEYFDTIDAFLNEKLK